jgi:hypothetical protein
MRWMLVALLAGCGGSPEDCRQLGQQSFTATRQETTTSVYGSCADLPMTLSIGLGVQSGVWTFTESGGSFPADYSDPEKACYGFAVRDVSSDVYQHYVVHLDALDQSYMNTVRKGVCMARYSLRR